MIHRPKEVYPAFLDLLNVDAVNAMDIERLLRGVDINLPFKTGEITNASLRGTSSE